MRTRYIPIISAVAAMVMLAGCATDLPDPLFSDKAPWLIDAETGERLACESEAVVWDNGRKLIDAGFTDRLELKAGVKGYEPVRSAWEKAGGDPSTPDLFVMFKHPRNKDVLALLVIHARCVVHEEYVPAAAIMELVTGRKPVAQRQA